MHTSSECHTALHITISTVQQILSLEPLACRCRIAQSEPITSCPHSCNVQFPPNQP